MDEEDFDFGTSKKLKSAKTGRRAKKVDEKVEDSLESDSVQSDASPPKPRDRDAPPRASRRTGGWGEDRRKTMDELDDDRFKVTTETEKPQDSDDDIPVIPELETEVEVDSTYQIAMAPNVVVNRVATYRELDNDLLKHAQFLTLDNEIDLKLLARGLSSEADVQEEDLPWDWDRLFTEVSSELLTEWEAKNQREEEVAVA